MLLFVPSKREISWIMSGELNEEILFRREIRTEGRDQNPGQGQRIEAETENMVSEYNASTRLRFIKYSLIVQQELSML